jgi:hypothetical protein
MMPSELTRRADTGELLVLLVCWKSGPYGVLDQQGDRTQVIESLSKNKINDSPDASLSYEPS